MRNGIKFCLTCLGIAMALRLAFEAVTGQSVEMPNAPASTYHPPFWMGSGQEQNENPEPSAAEITKWRKEIDEANELWLKQDTDKADSEI